MKSSTYSFSSLVKQITQVGIGFLVMLLLTGDRPPAFVVNLTACSSIVFVTYSEARRLASESSGLYLKQELLSHWNPKTRMALRKALSYAP